MGFSIIKTKSYREREKCPGNSRFDLNKWRGIVNSDDELIWMEDSPLAEEYQKIGKEILPEEKSQHNCYYEINKKYGYGNLRLYFHDDYIAIECERQTLKRVEKMWQIAEALNGYLFKNGTRFTEKKLEKLREKYEKSGKKAPNDD